LHSVQKGATFILSERGEWFILVSTIKTSLFAKGFKKVSCHFVATNIDMNYMHIRPVVKVDNKIHTPKSIDNIDRSSV